MKELNFLCQEIRSIRLKQKTTFASMFLLLELTFPIFISGQKFENSMDLLLIFDGDESRYVYIKDFDRFMFHKTKTEFKK